MEPYFHSAIRLHALFPKFAQAHPYLPRYYCVLVQHTCILAPFQCIDTADLF